MKDLLMIFFCNLSNPVVHNLRFFGRQQDFFVPLHAIAAGMGLGARSPLASPLMDRWR